MDLDRRMPVTDPYMVLHMYMHVRVILVQRLSTSTRKPGIRSRHVGDWLLNGLRRSDTGIQPSESPKMKHVTTPYVSTWQREEGSGSSAIQHSMSQTYSYLHIVVMLCWRNIALVADPQGIGYLLGITWRRILREY